MFVWLVRFILMIAGAVGGYQIGLANPPGLPQEYDIIGIIAYVILGISLGYVFGGILGRRLVEAFNRVEETIVRLSWSDILLAIAGLVIGLLVAFLVSYPFRYIEKPEGLRTFLIIASFAVLGYLGVRLALRKREEVVSSLRVFGSGRGAAALSEGSQKLIDTSVIIDGRITDICRTGFLEGPLVVPRFILVELQAIADSEDTVKRNRGRRGLDVLNTLRRDSKVNVRIEETDYPDLLAVDARLVRLAQDMKAVVLTNDYNLNKVAELQGVKVLNINELANALKPVVLPGEDMKIFILREGKETGQGVGYLDDGTMVVVEGGKEVVGSEAGVTVTSVLQTSAGRMIFTKLKS